MLSIMNHTRIIIPEHTIL